MKKTLLISRVFPPQIGGSGRWMWELYSRLPREKVVVAAGHWPGSDQFDAEQTYPIHRLPLHFDSWGAFGWHSSRAYLDVDRRLRQVVRDEHIEAIHAACCLPEGLLAWLLCRRLKLAYTVYAHGEELNVVHSSRELKWLTQRVFAGAERIVANSHNTAALLQRGWRIPCDRLHVLHPAVDSTQFRPAAFQADVRESLGWGQRPVILSVGRLQPRKGHDQLIRALAIVLRSVPAALLAIVGDGAERAALAQQVDAAGLSEHVRFYGEMTGADLVTAYQQCDISVLANRDVGGDIEGFGIVLLEAQACGKPVVAGNSGGTAETIDEGRTGFVVDCTNTEKLAAAIVRLLGDSSLRETMGIAARRWIETRFDWQVAAAAAGQLFGAAATSSAADSQTSPASSSQCATVPCAAIQ